MRKIGFNALIQVLLLFGAATVVGQSNSSEPCPWERPTELSEVNVKRIIRLGSTKENSIYLTVDESRAASTWIQTPASTGTELRRLDFSATNVVYDSLGKYVVLIDDIGKAQLWDTETWQILTDFTIYTDQSAFHPLSVPGFSTDAGILAFQVKESTSRLVEVPSFSKLHDIEHTIACAVGDGLITEFSFDSSSERVFLRDACTLSVWDVASNEPTEILAYRNFYMSEATWIDHRKIRVTVFDTTTDLVLW